MSQVALSLAELLAVVLVAVTLAVTDGAALSRLGIAWLAKRLGVEPGEVVAYRNATDEEAGSPDESAK
jgi:hypothetical protein